MKVLPRVTHPRKVSYKLWQQFVAWPTVTESRDDSIIVANMVLYTLNAMLKEVDEVAFKNENHKYPN